MSLFNRVRKAFHSSGDQADIDPHAWELLSSYSASKQGGTQTVIPSPNIFTNASIPREPRAGDVESILLYPSISHAALDVEVDNPPAYEEKPGAISPSGPTRLPESGRWNLLIKLAIARFAAWWSNIDRVFIHVSAYAHRAGPEVAIQLTKDYLPPLDVLLVWYAFILDSDAYSAACCAREEDVPSLQQLCFPWPAIRDAIDMEKMQLELPRSAQNLFSSLSGQSADVLTYLNDPPAYTDTDMLPFGVDLFTEVKKHDKFIDEAHSLLWIRAPALCGSLARASAMYLDYQLSGAAARSEGGDAPFGVDLLWRTHRLFPKLYDLFLHEIQDNARSGDTKSPTPLEPDVKVQDPETRPKHCSCWTCERIRDDLPTFIHTLPTHAISSSSTTSTREQLSSLSSDQLHQVQDDLGFYNAVENARRRGKPLPTRPPTAAEKETERIGKERQKNLGYLPGQYEYIEILPDGRRKIRKQTNAAPWKGLWWAV